MKSAIAGAFGAACFVAGLAPWNVAVAQADLQNVGQCTVGMRVRTVDNHTGTITRVDRSWSSCYVRQDDTGNEVGYLYSLLQPAGGAANGANAAAGEPLPAGVYECWVDRNYSFMNIRITGPGTYLAANVPGRYHIEKSGNIVFETGSLKEDHGKLLAVGRIGLNQNGDSFYETDCELNRNKH